MAGLEALVDLIYHEKQQPGSMLCAQHALNNLLQGNYFTAPDLSDIARGLDELEESYDDSNLGNTSTNMDDTGFFSVQVLDNALKVWGLNLIRWRSEEMRPYHAHPEKQLGFILNLEQHWFTLRRFGNASPDMDRDDGNGHWFNLNSFLQAPEWVSKLYLGMVLQQSEAEGYSVFVVTQADTNSPLALPRTQADVIASTLPEPTSSSSNTRIQRPSTTSRNSPPPLLPAGDHFEEEDYELQAALQASLMGGSEASTSSAHTPASFAPRLVPHELPEDPEPTPTLSANPPVPSLTPTSGSSTGLFLPGHADIDPVAASMERNRVLLQRMREQQEFAQREVWSEEELSPEEQAALEERRARRRQEQEAEEEELRKAIEESEALALQHSLDASVPAVPEVPQSASGSHRRIHDDEDAELQAALKASLEQHQATNTEPETDDEQSILSESTTTFDEPGQGAEAPSLDEVRRARLARFGL